MPVRVEFYGIPRVRSGVDHTFVEGNTLGEIIEELGNRYPGLRQCCVEGRNLRPGYIVNLDGNSFVSDPLTRVSSENSVLLMSIDAGG